MPTVHYRNLFIVVFILLVIVFCVYSFSSPSSYLDESLSTQYQNISHQPNLQGGADATPRPTLSDDNVCFNDASQQCIDELTKLNNKVEPYRGEVYAECIDSSKVTPSNTCYNMAVVNEFHSSPICYSSTDKFKEATTDVEQNKTTTTCKSIRQRTMEPQCSQKLNEPACQEYMRFFKQELQSINPDKYHVFNDYMEGVGKKCEKLQFGNAFLDNCELPQPLTQSINKDMTQAFVQPSNAEIRSFYKDFNPIEEEIGTDNVRDRSVADIACFHQSNQACQLYGVNAFLDDAKIDAKLSKCLDGNKDVCAIIKFIQSKRPWCQPLRYEERVPQEGEQLNENDFVIPPEPVIDTNILNSNELKYRNQMASNGLTDAEIDYCVASMDKYYNQYRDYVYGESNDTVDDGIVELTNAELENDSLVENTIIPLPQSNPPELPRSVDNTPIIPDNTHNNIRTNTLANIPDKQDYSLVEIISEIWAYNKTLWENPFVNILSPREKNKIHGDRSKLEKLIELDAAISTPTEVPQDNHPPSIFLYRYNERNVWVPVDINTNNAPVDLTDAVHIHNLNPTMYVQSFPNGPRNHHVKVFKQVSGNEWDQVGNTIEFTTPDYVQGLVVRMSSSGKELTIGYEIDVSAVNMAKQSVLDSTIGTIPVESLSTQEESEVTALVDNQLESTYLMT